MYALFGITIVILATAYVVALPIAEGAPVEDDFHLYGDSSLSEQSAMSLAITDKARVVYPRVNWYLYLAEDIAVRHYDHNHNIVVDEVLSAGLHRFSYVLDPEQNSVILEWSIGDEMLTYNLRIASSASQALEYSREDIISVSSEWLDDELKAIAIGCIACALIPAISVIPIIRRKTDNDVFEVL